MADQITDPGLEGFSDKAFEEPGEGGLTTEQLAFRIHAKREGAMQDAGWLEPPGPDAPLEAVEAPEPPLEEAPDDESEAEPEAEPDEEPELEETEEEEPGEEEAPEEQEALDEQEEFYLARFRDKEAAEKGWQEAQWTIQRLYDERNERLQAEQQQPQGPQELDIGAWSEWAAELVEQGAGIEGARAALTHGDTQGFDIYMAHWLQAEDPDERVQAALINGEVQRQFAARRATEAVRPQFEQTQEQHLVEEAMLARQIAGSQHDDFDEYLEEMDALVRSENGMLSEATKAWLAEESQKGVEGKVRAWDHLYLAARASRGPRQQQATTVERRRRTMSSDAAKIAATVSTSEGSAARNPPNEAELAVIRKRNAIREKLGQPLLEEQ
jgi:hypothetical protein